MAYLRDAISRSRLARARASQVARNDGSRTVIKRGKHHVKKVDIDANGDKTVVKKTVY